VRETQQRRQKSKNQKLKSLGKDKCFQVAFKSVNGMNSTKWRRQLVPRAWSSHSKRAATRWWRGTCHCDRARRGGSEACSSGGRCGRRRDKVGQITWCFAKQAMVHSYAQLVLNTLLIITIF